MTDTIEPTHLFVYGTLRRGGHSVYAPMLETRGRFVGEGYVNGRAQNLGHYPGAVLDEKGPELSGEIFDIGADDGTLIDILDRYEGCHADDLQPHEYIRQITTATLRSGVSLPVWIYCFTGHVKGQRL